MNSKQDNDSETTGKNFLDNIPPQNTTRSVNIHLTQLLNESPHHPILTPQFYDLTGNPNDKDDLIVFLKLLLETSVKDFVGTFPIHGIILVFDCCRK
jgi:hypothetical protein